jgi:alkylhydroperoxidase family enzyme
LQLGANEDEMMAARRYESADAKADAALKFVKALLEKRGHAEDSNVEAVRAAGYDDGEIVELVANVALTVFTNFINDTAETEIDFPLAPDLP